MKYLSAILAVIWIAIISGLGAGIAYAAIAAGEKVMDLPWWTIDGGGIQTEAGSYTLLATVGQPDAAQVSANWYELRSGYWPGATIRHPLNYLLPTGLAIEHYVSYGQITIVALVLILIAISRRRRVVTA